MRPLSKRAKMPDLSKRGENMTKANKEIKHLPFSVLNAAVKEKLANTAVYQSANWSFMKIFEHAITYVCLRNDHKLVKHRMAQPLWVHELRAIAKRWRDRRPVKNRTSQSIILLDPARLIQGAEGSYFSIYMDRWKNLIPSEKCTVVQRKADARIACDYSLADLPRTWGRFDSVERAMLSEIQTVYQQAERSHSFDAYEMEHIGSALSIFWEDFRFYHQWLKKTEAKKLLFICHYHNEGLIAACRVNGIQSIELQHGLISCNDLYYVYDQQFAAVTPKAMFPDLMCVYGDYWRQVVLQGVEYQPAQVVVAGDYLYRKPSTKGGAVGKENLILVCAQKLMHADYLHYISLLHEYVRAHPDWKVVVKMHPLEPRKEVYEVVKTWGFELVDMEVTLDDLLRRAKIQISIYSTTFFDAIGFDVVNFSIQAFGTSSDYAAEIVRESVAIPITIDENPIDKYMTEKDRLHMRSRQDIYGTFNTELARALLL
jgi:hypothetical protein